MRGARPLRRRALAAGAPCLRDHLVDGVPPFAPRAPARRAARALVGGQRLAGEHDDGRAASRRAAREHLEAVDPGIMRSRITSPGWAARLSSASSPPRASAVAKPALRRLRPTELAGARVVVDHEHLAAARAAVQLALTTATSRSGSTGLTRYSHAPSEKPRARCSSTDRQDHGDVGELRIDLDLREDASSRRASAGGCRG